jgi:lipopolysaccharide biosynthesis regulator YciM
VRENKCPFFFRSIIVKRLFSASFVVLFLAIYLLGAETPPNAPAGKPDTAAASPPPSTAPATTTAPAPLPASDKLDNQSAAPAPSPLENSTQSNPKENPDEFDTVIMLDGTKHRGQVIDTHGDMLEVKRMLGSITVEKNQVKEIIWAKRSPSSKEKAEDVVYLSSGERHTGKVAVSEDGKTVILTKLYRDKEQTVFFPKSDVIRIDYASGASDNSSTALDVPQTVRREAARLSSGNPLEILEAKKRLVALGIAAVAPLWEIRPALPEESRKIIDEVLYTAELKKYATKNILKSIPDFTDKMVSSDSETRADTLKDVILMSAEDAVPLFVFLMNREDEDLSIRVFCMNYLAEMDKNIELVNLLNSTKNGRVRLLAAIYLGDNGIYAGIETLIKALLLKDAKIRDLASRKLIEFTEQNFGFDPYGKEEERAKACQKWSEWWEKNRDEYAKKLPQEVAIEEPANLDVAKADIYFGAAMKSWRDGDLDIAEANFRKTFELQPNHVSARTNYAAVMLEKRQYAAARKQLEIVLKRYVSESGDMGQKRAYYYLGLVDLDELKWPDAKANFEYALNLDSSYLDARIALGRTCYLQARSDPAYKLTEADMKDSNVKAAKLRDYNDLLARAELHLIKANDLIADKFKAEKDTSYREALADANQDTEVEARKEKKKFSTLGKDERAAFLRDLQIKGAHVHSMLAEVYFISNKTDKALEEMVLAVKFDPTNAYYHLRLGQLYEMRGLVEKAVDSFRKASELQNGYMPAEEGIIRLQPAYEKIISQKKDAEKPKPPEKPEEQKK